MVSHTAVNLPKPSRKKGLKQTESESFQKFVPRTYTTIQYNPSVEAYPLHFHNSSSFFFSFFFFCFFFSPTSPNEGMRDAMLTFNGARAPPFLISAAKMCGPIVSRRKRVREALKSNGLFLRAPSRLTIFFFFPSTCMKNFKISDVARWDFRAY